MKLSLAPVIREELSGAFQLERGAPDRIRSRCPRRCKRGQFGEVEADKLFAEVEEVATSGVQVE